VCVHTLYSLTHLSASPRSLAFQCLPNPSVNSKQCETVPLSTEFGIPFTSYHFFPSFHYRVPPMPPSRRKGVSKAAAAAAACRQWKVGDLVLAKVKGFPAWPATFFAGGTWQVSEPEKWGYSTDWKKVLVYFFGTQQIYCSHFRTGGERINQVFKFHLIVSNKCSPISVNLNPNLRALSKAYYIVLQCGIAFCNPADVEAFTEDKKLSLLGKRHGKGADFGRAVQEIIDSFEKLKKETKLDEIASGDDANADVSNPVNSSANDQIDAPELTHTLPLNSSNSIISKHEVVCAAEDDSTAVFKDESHNKEAFLGEPTDKIAVVKTPKPVTYSSRKRSLSDLCLQGCVTLTHRHTSVRRSRNSSRAQNFVLPCNDSGKSASDPSTTAAQSAPTRRNKHVRKSPDLSGCNDFESSAFVLNSSMEDNSSEIITTDSDTFSLNEGSTIDSNFKLELAETIECPEVELNKGLDLKIKSVVNKKKRNPNRKRAANDASKPNSGPEEETGVQNASQSSQNICGNSKERCFEQDGDEHLPLVKRARVRMGKSSVEAELHSTLQSQEKNCKEDINSAQQMITSSNCENSSPADGDSSVLNGAQENVSPKISVLCSNTQICNTKKEQTFSSVDGEATLPPSKRLHRALEAMSANAAKGSSSIITSSGMCCISSVKTCNQEGDGLGLQKLDTCNIDSSHVNVYSFSTSTNPMISAEDKSPIQVGEQLTKIQQHDTGKDILRGATDQVGEELSDHMVCQEAKVDLKIQSNGQISPNLDSKCCDVGSNQDSPDPSLPPNDEDNIRTVNHSNTAFDASEHNGISLDPVMGVNENDIFLPDNVDVPRNEVAACEDTECLKPALGDVSTAYDMSEVVKEVKCKGPDEDVNYVSASDDCLGEKGISDIRSSPSLTDGGDCIPQGSPPTTSVCNVSTSDSSNILHNGSCSPDVHLHQKQTLSGPVDGSKDGYVATQQSRYTGKSTEAGRAALLYFEAMLGTLTRTKESIGRATRIAIDCAKFGIAAKVMEILAHSLEMESSLHRRVDLFFLVDSIAQFSRGDVGGVYSSAIQAVLPQLLSAAAPPGNTAQENRRQLWLERRILPESIIRRHIRELDLYSSSASAAIYLRRSLRTERALDDPVREMEGMLVDEYGSNSTFQLPGFCMPRMLKDDDGGEGSDSDGGNFEAVTPEHTSEVHEITSAIGKHRHILEDVDGELEMEDVAPSNDVEINSICNVDKGNVKQAEKNTPLSFASLHQDVRSSSPPLPSFLPPPPPPPPPPPVLHPMASTSEPYHTVVNSTGYTVSQTLKDNPLHSVAQPMAAPRHSQPISDAVHHQVPEYREMVMHMPESTCSYNSFPVPPPDNFRQTDGVTMHHKGYSIRPPQHVPSNQFSFVNGEHHVKQRREVRPPPSYSSRQHYVQNMERENFYNNHERLRPPPYDYQERWNIPAPYPGPQYQDKGVPAPYGCHPCESTRIPDHGWRFPPRSMNQRNSMPFRPPFEDAIPVANRECRAGRVIVELLERSS
ncbi:Protein HUA2-LIKE 3, partial [Mucuna pruriens]